MKHVVLLIVIAYMDIGAQAKISLIGREQLIEDLKDRGLAGAVITDESHMFPPANGKSKPTEEFFISEGFCQILHMQNFPAALDAGGQGKAHVVP